MGIRKVPRCVHCGEALQEKDPSEKGYVSKMAKGEEGDFPVLCDTCYKEMGWNDEPKENAVDPSYLQMLEAAKKRNPLFIYVIDLFSFECSFVPSVSKALEGASLLVLGNKRDLLPKEENDLYLSSYIALRFQEAGMRNVTEKDVYLTSVHSEEDLERVKKAIDGIRKGRDVFVIGCTKSGKTLLIDAFLATYRNKTKSPIFHGPFEGTDCGVLEIPLGHSSTLYDTPGFHNDNSLYGQKETPKEILLSEGQSVERRTLSIENGGSLFVGLLAHLDSVKAERKTIPLHCYFAPKVELKRITPKKDMSSLFDKYLQKKAMKPRLPSLKSGKDYDAFEFSVENDGERDFAIAGLGWINLAVRKGEIYRLYLPKGIGVSFNEPKIKTGKELK